MKILSGLLGVALIAAVAGLLWQSKRIEQLTRDNTALREQAASRGELERQLEQARRNQVDPAELDRLRSLQSEVLQLRARVNSGQRAESEVAQLKSELTKQKSESQDNVQFPAAVGEAAKGMIEQQMMGRLSRMKGKLNLTPQQDEAIAGILKRQAEQGAELAQKMFSGKMSREEMAQASRGMGDPEEQIKALLSPEQQTAYQELKQEENVGNARLAANAEMLQLQNAVGLSQEQQDQVFAAFYEHTLKQMNGNVKPSPDGANMEAFLEQQIAEKTKALESILTPVQLESYRKLQETQIKMIRTMMPKMTAPAPPAAPPLGPKP